MIYFVTGNRGKFEEAQEILGEVEQRNIGYVEIQADTLEEVAAFGIREVAEKLASPAMIEDAGLFINGLKGFPGVYSAYVFDTIGNDGVLRLMEGIEDRRAAFRSVVAYAEAGGEPVVFAGELEGEIATEPRGSGGFGYDPIFEVGNKTIAEMDLSEKNSISHRGRSIRALESWLSSR
ncbi:XTP/dITP diphosphatase [Methanotrichaceae archaeon M04Ac]|jgi:XTP/dITP diphosphohydrolase|uniref:dITP/XTP pyrophosphatase n=1 Tax=Candidatus Methanocrinis alkalitolerans TaxID=3033395 RepID=A0ABT5XFG8_9EURY|nr:XTP/dITP diphosphatase [Candidatus Methanocrinis alkalitolerans]MCR3883007.1 XTP/dITP diphosphatase [Methanothrix sp.]MDF0593417.1 XTP/dITP diphosphatase [Candidatus Methanocrinis alkalitolerans]